MPTSPKMPGNDSQEHLAGAALAAAGIEPEPEKTGRLLLLAELLAERNKTHNLTAVTGLREVCLLHFLDSLAALRFFPPPEGALCIDVGSGAGFPALPLLIARPDLRFVMLEATGKKAAFIGEFLVRAGMAGKSAALHGRAEELGRDAAHRERYDAAFCRAVAPLGILCELCAPFVKPGGRVIAYKGAKGADELRSARRAITELRCAVASAVSYSLGEEGFENAEYLTEPFAPSLASAGAPDNRRVLIDLVKVGELPAKYPRKYADIKKRPII